MYVLGKKTNDNTEMLIMCVCVCFGSYDLPFFYFQHVTSSGCKNLTNCPRETWEIEAVMAGALWTLEKNSQP